MGRTTIFQSGDYKIEVSDIKASEPLALISVVHSTGHLFTSISLKRDELRRLASLMLCHAMEIEEPEQPACIDYEMAHRLADDACWLDVRKNNPDITPETRQLMTILESGLHDVAEMLAGKRVSEIYHPEDTREGVAA
jgi:hypothetical protein